MPSNLIAAFTSGIVLLLSIWGGKRSGLRSIDASKEMVDVHKCMMFLGMCEGRWHSAGRLWDILAELASVGELPLPGGSPGATNKRPREADPADATIAQGGMGMGVGLNMSGMNAGTPDSSGSSGTDGSGSGSGSGFGETEDELMILKAQQLQQQQRTIAGSRRVQQAQAQQQQVQQQQQQFMGQPTHMQQPSHQQQQQMPGVGYSTPPNPPLGTGYSTPPTSMQNYQQLPVYSNELASLPLHHTQFPSSGAGAGGHAVQSTMDFSTYPSVSQPAPTNFDDWFGDTGTGAQSMGYSAQDMFGQTGQGGMDQSILQFLSMGMGMGQAETQAQAHSRGHMPQQQQHYSQQVYPMSHSQSQPQMQQHGHAGGLSGFPPTPAAPTNPGGGVYLPHAMFGQTQTAHASHGSMGGNVGAAPGMWDMAPGPSQPNMGTGGLGTVGGGGGGVSGAFDNGRMLDSDTMAMWSTAPTGFEWVSLLLVLLFCFRSFR
jgi:hypothetical protein